ncbi:MAG: hypothetical protein ACUVV6_03135 [Thermoplasmatota archaeon]
MSEVRVKTMRRQELALVVGGMVLFGSVWGMLECVLGGVKLEGPLAWLPMGAVLGGFFGLGLMALSRRIYGVAWMQLGMAAVAGLIRFWAPVGSCVICSALAIVAEGLVFELIFNRPALSLTRASTSPLLRPGWLALTGVVAGYVIYVTGYMFTQFFTPIIAPPHVFTPSNFVAALPLIFGRGLFAAILGGASLPLAVSVRQLHIDVSAVRKRVYYPVTVSASALCWVLALTLV